MFDPELFGLASMVEVSIAVAILTALGAKLKSIDGIIRKNDEKAGDNNRHISEQLSSFRVEVAMTYASISYIRDIEERLTSHLIRIEEKIARQP